MKLYPTTLVIAIICCVTIACLDYLKVGGGFFAISYAFGGVLGMILIPSLITVLTYYIAKRSNKAANVACSIMAILALSSQLSQFGQARTMRDQRELKAVMQQGNRGFPKKLNGRLEITARSYDADAKTIYYDSTVLGPGPFPKSPQESRSINDAAQKAWLSLDPGFMGLITNLKTSV